MPSTANRLRVYIRLHTINIHRIPPAHPNDHLYLPRFFLVIPIADGLVSPVVVISPFEG
jgi:hypothetical protein